MAATAHRVASSDRPVLWTVAGLATLGTGLNAPMFLLPKLANSLAGETIYALLLLSGVAVAVGLAILCVGLARGWTAARDAPVGSMRRYFAALRVPIAIALVTVLVGYAFDIEILPIWVFDGIRAFAAGLAGWLVARYGFSVWKCAMAGLLLFALDHVAVKTVTFAATFEWLAIGGVLLSFGMFALVPMAIATAAGLVAKRMPQR